MGQAAGVPHRVVSQTSVRRVRRRTGPLADETVARMQVELAWFGQLDAEIRSYVGLVAQAGISGFVDWLAAPESSPAITVGVFGAAPRSVARAVTLPQVVELVRLVTDVIEQRAPELAAPGEESLLREAILRYAREVAFGAAQVYASAAEERGAWDARLESLLVDALLSGDEAGLDSRAAALGWGSPTLVYVVVGGTPDADAEMVLDTLRRTARHAHAHLLAGVHGRQLIAVVGSVDDAQHDPTEIAARLVGCFDAGPVVVGPVVGLLADAHRSAAAALSGLLAAAAWPGAPRPVAAEDLLPERALAGDLAAVRHLVAEIYQPLVANSTGLLETVYALTDGGGSVEATARELFLHANTVRYRLRKVAELTGRDPLNPRDAFVLQVALRLGRLTPPGRLL